MRISLYFWYNLDLFCSEDLAKMNWGYFLFRVVRTEFIPDMTVPEFSCWASHDLELIRNRHSLPPTDQGCGELKQGRIAGFGLFES